MKEDFDSLEQAIRARRPARRRFLTFFLLLLIIIAAAAVFSYSVDWYSSPEQPSGGKRGWLVPLA